MTTENPKTFRERIRKALEINNFESITEAIEEASTGGDCIATCEKGCIVEPDGFCTHDQPSILLALGLI